MPDASPSEIRAPIQAALLPSGAAYWCPPFSFLGERGLRGDRSVCALPVPLFLDRVAQVHGITEHDHELVALFLGPVGTDLEQQFE